MPRCTHTRRSQLNPGKRLRVGLLGTLASLIAVYFVLSQVNIAELGAVFARVRWEWLTLCAMFLVFGLGARAWRWQVLLSGALPLVRSFTIMNVSYLVNGLLPLRMGEVARAFLATRAQPPVPVFQSVSTIIVERLLDLLAVVVLVMIALASGTLPDEIRAAAVFLGPLALAGFLVLVALSTRRRLVHRLLAALSRRIALLRRWPLARLVDQFLDGLAPLARPRALALALLATAISWGFSVVAGYVLMYAIWDTASWATTCLFIAAASLAIAVPAVPGNVGTYELSILLALGASGYGEPASAASAFAILVHGVNLVVYAILGIVGFIQEGVSLEQLSQGVQRFKSSQSQG